MSIEDDERRHHEEDLAAARSREERSRAARDNALERGYMRPDLAGPSIDRFYKNKGIYALRDRFDEETGPSVFGVKRGNPFTREGRAARADANEARRDLPDLWDSHAQDRKNRDAVERAFAERYGPQHVQDDTRLWSDAILQDREGMVVVLELLVERAEGLDDSIGQIESQIERSLQGLAAGTGDVAKVMEIIAERRKTQLERAYQLGEARAQIDELENRIQEHDEREWERQAEQERENVPVAEDHLDWLRPALNAPEAGRFQGEQHQHREGEERMLEEMHREGRKPEDYLDWLKR